MLKLNHTERGIAIVALAEAETNWDRQAREVRKSDALEADRLVANAAHAHNLRVRFEEEQS